MSRAPRQEGRAQRDPNVQATAKKAPARGASAAAERKDRVPLGVARTKLTVPQRAGYRRRWINDDGKGRLQAAANGGYTFVTDPDLKVGEDGGGDKPDSRVSRIVGRTQEGKPMRAFLMEIPRELYKADQTSKQSALDEVDRAIRKGRVVSQGEDSRYVPDEGKAIRVESEIKSPKAAAEEDDPNE